MTGLPARPRILLTNDDGIASPGLAAAHAELARLGEVVVVAPAAEQSAMGHAITTLEPLRIQSHAGGAFAGHSVNGTPADCVKIALGTIFDRPPDLVVSGINLGPNTAAHVIYSGTVSAATEARILGIPSIAVSLDAHREPRWEAAATIARRLSAMVLTRGLPDQVLLNVNVPNLAEDQIQGVRLTRQGNSRFAEEVEEGVDPRGHAYYWLAGAYRMTDQDPTTDSWAVEHGYVSITPLTYDMTADHAMDALSAWDLAATLMGQ